MSISAKRSHLSCVLVTAGKDMGVTKDGVVVHLTWVVEKLPGLITAVARVDLAWGWRALPDLLRQKGTWRR